MYKLGKLPPKPLLKTPSLGDFLSPASTWPPVAPRGYEYAVPDSLLLPLGNDQYGDCAEAGAMHLIQVETANSGNPLHATQQMALDYYSHLTGFNEVDPSSDRGTVLADLLQDWKENGIKMLDRFGKETVHTIRGWASLDIRSVAQIRYACDVFGGAYLGISCPQSALQNTNNWKWSPNSPVVGGHCINMAGQGGAGLHIQSWGKNIPATWEFLLNTLDEAYVVVSDFWIDKAKNQSPSGLDMPGLLDALGRL